jgi:hypothetical protein
VSSELADVELALDLANKVSWGDQPGGAKSAALASVSRLRSKLDALDAQVITAFEATQEHKAQGHASAIGWLEHNCRTHGDDAAGRRRLARRLRHHPLAEEALAAGAITARHVDVLDRARRLVGDDAYRIGEQVLVDLAVARRFCDFQRSVDYFVLRARPRGADEREAQQIRDRWCSSSRTLDGAGKVDAWLPPQSFTVFDAELQHLTDHLYQQDVAEARERLGRQPLASELARTSRQRRADALERMARRSAAYGDQDLPESSYVVNVHAGTDLVAQILERLVAALRDSSDDDLDPDDLQIGPDDLCEDDDGNVITVNTLVLALLTGTVRGYLHDPDGVPLRYGRARRLFTRAQADALRARFRRCCHPYGCGRSGTRLQSNHVTEHRHGGNTDIDDGDPRCGPHNRWHTNTHGQPPPDGPPDTGQRRTPPDLGPPPLSPDHPGRPAAASGT